MIITNCTLVTCSDPNQLIYNAGLYINGGIIAKIGASRDIKTEFPDDFEIDGKNQYLMPGMICAHTHYYGVFSRGMAIRGEPPKDFPAILKQLWWPLDQSLHSKDVYYSTLVCLIDAIKHGTTTIFDHHASPNFITGSLDVIEKALREAGIRGSVCYELTDRGGRDKSEEGIQENIRMIEKINSDKNQDAMITAMFGLHAGLTLSDETLTAAVNGIPDGFGFHVHVAEHQCDEEDSINKSGKRVINRLEELGITGKNSIFVHGVHLNSEELVLIKNTGTWLTHQPRSNMNNAVGMANIGLIDQMGIPVCLGNDGFSFNMWDEWRTCYLSHKLWNKDPRSMPGDLVFKMGIGNNAKLAQHFFSTRVGVIETGAKADLILVDYDPITTINTDNLPWHILFGFRDSMVTTTIVNGKVLMLDRELTTLNETEITAEARKVSAEVWKRYNNQ